MKQVLSLTVLPPLTSIEPTPPAVSPPMVGLVELVQVFGSELTSPEYVIWATAVGRKVANTAHRPKIVGQNRAKNRLIVSVL
jgi:hypothetical protein